MTGVIISANPKRGNIYHENDSCPYVKKIPKTREEDKELLDAWGWKLCKWCSDDITTEYQEGVKLSTLLERMDPDDLPLTEGAHQ